MKVKIDDIEMHFDEAVVTTTPEPQDWEPTRPVIRFDRNKTATLTGTLTRYGIRVLTNWYFIRKRILLALLAKE